ncbi:site-specific DNA-methyltransferase [Desulforamulus aquiferis]|uniref:Site-specific DNA-methyltransferase n=1 Tax=Desulforamulus aquiferis TaxID=1397668 RepID=A0AAW7ZDR7_9FIRM|nr:site-specific DNA-methyltransferase [Desulforamulus aquiferis]MDO7787877.1 site-specific DNA-methyltransferase [Desulforamulus aquiferis]
MSTKLEEFKKIIRQMFQFDQADLDFGIYRIMNQRRAEVERFLDQDLLPNVKKAFGSYEAQDRAKLQEELENLRKQLEQLGVDPETSAKYIEKKNQLEQSPDLAALESDVYSHLVNFFRRYYHEGDFLSLRRYKKDVYALPYEGEEVKLHWANADQYYIKTSEYLRDYLFTLPSGRRVHFKLVEASTEQNNNKAPNGKERRFVLDEEKSVVEENGELYISFNFIPQEKKVKQAELNNNSLSVLFRDTIIKARWQELCTLMPTEKNKKRTLLEKHLNDYTSKNTFDYFIHKDLGGFLRRELDFYIKNEVMFLDDLGTSKEMKLEQYIAKIRAIKEVGHKIIKFLEQLENFQKKLWLKKKFVVETNYCITLDRVKEEFYPEISVNRAQTEEWEKLFAINEIVADGDKPGFSEPLSVKFLKAHPYLILDTAFFGQDFKERLLATIENLEEQIDGLLVWSENFQALNLLQERYKERIKCVYIDPPYNAKSSEIMYKNGFKHSSWNSMILNGLLKTKVIMSEDGIIEFAIDDYELKHTLLLFETVFGEDNFIANIGIVHNPRGRNDDKFFGTSHEYMTVFAKNINTAEIGLFELSESDVSAYNKTDGISNYSTVPYIRTGNNSYRFERPNLFYPIYYNPKSEEISLDKKDGCIELLPINSKGEEKTWRWGKETFLERCKTELIVKEDGLDYKVFKKRRLEGAGKKPKTIWFDSKYDASSHGIMLLRNMFGLGNHFSYPKSLYTVYDALFLISKEDSIILDYFAGSGTTGHAVINLNREDDGNRKYILVEMGEYFDTVLKPRIQKAIYSKDWKDGKPVSRQGTSNLFKYIRLESYEDTMNNLVLKRPAEHDSLFAQHANLREEYILSYMLDIESNGSASLLNLDYFKDPFNYKLKVTRNQETKEEVIDLVETFNYLLGLQVQHIETRETFNAIPDEGADKPGTVKLRMVKNGQGEYIFKIVEGLNPAGERVMVIWRNLTGDIARDNAALNAYFARKGYNTKDNEFDRIYVNGDNNLANLSVDEGSQWKVLLIEEEFKRLMFDVQDV